MAISGGKVKSYISKAQNGNPKAQYNLGIAFLNGDHVPHDIDKAEVLFQQAAEMGHENAQFALDNIDYIRENDLAASGAGLRYESFNWNFILIPVIIVALLAAIGSVVYFYFFDPTDEIAENLVTVLSEDAYPPRTGKKLLIVDNFEDFYRGLYMDIRCNEVAAIAPETREEIYTRMNEISRLMEITSAEVERMQIDSYKIVKDWQDGCKNEGVMPLIAQAKNLLMDDKLRILLSMEAGNAARELVGATAQPQSRPQPSQAQSPQAQAPQTPQQAAPAPSPVQVQPAPQQASRPTTPAQPQTEPSRTADKLNWQLQVPVFTEEQKEFYRQNHPEYYAKLMAYYKELEAYRKKLDAYRKQQVQ